MLSASNLKKVAVKVYKKVPKKTLIKKAATFGAKQVLGGPYLDLFGFIFKRSKKKVITYAGSYAYDSFFRSEFARTKINALPIAVVSIIVRSIGNFLISTRLKTGIWWLDFLISIIVTIIITISSPFIYKSIAVHDKFFMKYTDIFMDNFLGPGGWEYLDRSKNILLLGVGAVLILILQFVSITSRDLQEIIIHSLITGFISDQLQKYVEDVNKPVRVWYGMTRIDHTEYARMLGPHNFTTSISHRINICNTKNRLILNAKPCKAVIILHKNIRSENITDNPETRKNKISEKGVKFLSIIEDYNH